MTVKRTEEYFGIYWNKTWNTGGARQYMNRQGGSTERRDRAWMTPDREWAQKRADALTRIGRQWFVAKFVLDQDETGNWKLADTRAKKVTT